MRYLDNARNLVRDAILSSSNFEPSRAYRRIDEDDKQGGGNVKLVGNYTGALSTAIDIEILDENGDERRVSQPISNAVGSGLISGISASLAVDPQTFVIKLEDLGTETVQARAPIQGSTLEAIPIGVLGNALSLTVDTSGLVMTPRGYSLPEALQQGQNAYVGDSWNFDTPALNDDGTIPDNAPRIRFGEDSQIYLADKKHVGEK